MSSKFEIKSKGNRSEEAAVNSLRACLVEGDAAQLARERRLRRRSLLISVAAQIVVLAALVLVPILSRPERIALANVVPVPPYHRAAGADHPVQRRHQLPSAHPYYFCLICPPVAPVAPTQSHNASSVGENSALFTDGGDSGPECTGCIDLPGKDQSQPSVPDAPTLKIIHLTHLDPAMLVHRVEPVFPTLARQAGREGRVELHAIIGIDGSVRSLQVLEGDPFFVVSALEAVRQWRYKATVLNGFPVEVDTHITVIYKLNR